MARGGARQGTPGRAYSNRSDLQAVKTGPSRQYGERAAAEAAQRALPMAGRPTVPPPIAVGASPATSNSGAPALGSSGPQPGQLTPLSAPTQRPNEPLTAGLAFGPGAGPEANPFGAVGSSDDAVLALRAAYNAYPSEELRAILQRLDDGA